MLVRVGLHLTPKGHKFMQQDNGARQPFNNSQKQVTIFDVDKGESKAYQGNIQIINSNIQVKSSTNETALLALGCITVLSFIFQVFPIAVIGIIAVTILGTSTLVGSFLHKPKKSLDFEPIENKGLGKLIKILGSVFLIVVFGPITAIGSLVVVLMFVMVVSGGPNS